MHATYITLAGGLVADRKHFWIHSNVRRGEEAHTNHANKIFSWANHPTKTPSIAHCSQIKKLSWDFDVKKRRRLHCVCRQRGAQLRLFGCPMHVKTYRSCLRRHWEPRGRIALFAERAPATGLFDRRYRVAGANMEGEDGSSEWRCKLFRKHSFSLPCERRTLSVSFVMYIIWKSRAKTGPCTLLYR